MVVKIKNNINIFPIFINGIWSLILVFLFIFRVSDFEKQRPEGASMLVFGTILITGLLFIISVIYIFIANFFKHFKLYYDLGFVFIPIIILTIFILLRM